MSSIPAIWPTPGAPPGSPVPKSPTLDWNNFLPHRHSAMPAVGDMAHKIFTTSGRAALCAALQQMSLAAGTPVLVPTYHCPTMVAPVLEAGLVPVMYPLTAQGLPDLDRIQMPDGMPPGAMFVAHYFGLPHDLQQVLAWCEERGITLVEDCAHSYFGMAGTRPVGHWGHYATASLSKFFPVAEAGVLASSTRPLVAMSVKSPGLRSEVKAAWDVLDHAMRFGRLSGLRPLLRLFRSAAPQPAAAETAVPLAPDASAMYEACDMGRIHYKPCRAALLLHALLPTERIVSQRRQHYQQLAAGIANAPGARALTPELPANCAPYVLPLWVDGAARADQVYALMRAQGMPVFRWDRLWPGTPVADSDAGAQWSRQVLQLLCHQDLRCEEVERTVQRLQAALHAVPHERLSATSNHPSSSGTRS